MGRRALVPPGATLFEAARRAGIQLAAACGGQGTCGQCVLTIIDGQVSPLTAEEAEYLEIVDLQEHRRLACCTRPYSPVVVRIPNSSLFPAGQEGDEIGG
jgi:ferredoxin